MDIIPKIIIRVLFMVYAVSFSLVRHGFGQPRLEKLARDGVKKSYSYTFITPGQGISWLDGWGLGSFWVVV